MRDTTDFKEYAKSGLIKFLETLKVYPSHEKLLEIERNIKSTIEQNKNISKDKLADKHIKARTALLRRLGYAAALPGVIPGLGTIAEVSINIGGTGAEIWYILRFLTVMNLEVAAFYGHDIHSEDRKVELLIVWGLETGAIIPAREAVKRIGQKFALKKFNEKVAGKIFQKINQKIGITVFTKFGTKRGGVAIGRLIPFGIGVIINGAVNHFTAKSFGKNAKRFYGTILPNDEDIFVSE